MSGIQVILSVVLAVAGSGGIVFGALRYNRDEAGKIVTQQTAVLTDMRGLNDELQEALNRVRDERDRLLEEVHSCREEIASLSGKVSALQDALAQVTWPEPPKP